MSQPLDSPISPRGVVDLSTLGRPAPPASTGSGATGPAGGGSFVQDVTDATFGALVELSARVPVVVDLWAEWCQPCKQLSPVLERLAEEHGGAFLLAKVDVDANPQVAQAFQVQSIPSVVAIVAGQPVPMFQGAYPEAQVRAIIDELLKVAAQNGVTGKLDAQNVEGEAAPAATEPAEPPLPPLHQAAYDALDREDLDGAAQAFASAMRENPRDAEAKAGLAQVDLLRRLRDADPAAALAGAQERPDDLEAQLIAADVEVATGRGTAGLERLIAVVRITSGPDRERVRLRLLELFEVVGAASPEVGAARRALASALY